MQATSLNDRSNRGSYFGCVFEGLVSSIFWGGIAAFVGCNASPSPPNTANSPAGSAESTAADSTATATSSASTGDKKVIGISVLTTTNPFFNVIADSFRAEAAQHGYEVDVKSGEFDVSRQRDQVKDWIVANVSAIVLCPCNSKSIGPAVKEANAAGIPVFTADIACLDAEAKIVSHIATDNQEGGRQAGHAMLERLGQTGGKVVILDYRDAESCLLRVQGFKEVIDQHNSAQPAAPIDIVLELPGNGDREQGLKCAQDALQAHPDLAGIFAINDPSALGACAALEKAGKSQQVTVIGFDGQPEGKRGIRDGKIFADPIQFPDKIGTMTMQTIVRYFAGETVEPVQLIPTSLYRQSDAKGDSSL